MSTGGALKTIGGALFDGAGIALRLIILLRVGMPGLPATGGSTTLSATDAWAHGPLAGDVTKVVLVERHYKVKG
jgi:hypothetical protein